jgi:orotate phosphoribosyltransferase
MRPVNGTKGYHDLLWSSGALMIRDEAFTLKSGRRSYTYANHRDLICVPMHLRSLTRLLSARAHEEFPTPYAFATVDSSVSPFLGAACALESEIPYYNYRAVSREKGVVDQLFRYDRIVETSFAPNLPAILVDDVVTTTGTLSNAARALEQRNINVLGAVCLLDRRVSSEASAPDFRLAAVTNLANVLRHGLKTQDLGPETQRLIDVELGALAK